MQAAIEATGETNGYAELTTLPSATVVVIDDDQAGVVITPSAVSPSEAAGSATFDVRLAKQPSATVGVALSSTLSRALLTTASSSTPSANVTVSFTPATWSMAQAVTVHGVDDAVAGGVAFGLIETSIDAAATTDTTGYATLAAGAIEDLQVELMDDEILYVDQSATGAADGSSWLDAFSTVQAALDAAVAGQQIWVAAGTYRPTATAADVSITMKANVELYGGFLGTERHVYERDLQAAETIVSGDYAGDDTPGVFDATRDDNAKTVVRGASYARLDGFTVRGGEDGTPVVISNKDYNLGAGMYNESVHNLYVGHVRFTDNRATNVGGATEGYGGGMGNVGSNLDLRDVSFISNSATSRGGGMGNVGSSPTLTDVTFTSNTAGTFGGGMYNNASSPTLTHVSFTSNSASANGDGIYNNSNSDPTLTNCAFGGHRADQDVFDNDVASVPIITYTCAEQALTGTGNVDLASSPFDVVAASGEVFLDQASGCVDAGSDTEANAAEASFASLGLLRWYQSTTSTDGTLDLDATPGEGTDDVDAGRHYDLNSAWIETFSESAGTLSFATHNAVSCELSSDADDTVLALDSSQLLSGSRSHTWPTDTTVILRCFDASGSASVAATTIP